MPKRVGGEKRAEPDILISIDQFSEVSEITTITGPKQPVEKFGAEKTSVALQDKEKLSHINAQELLDKSESELNELGIGKREAHNLAQTFRIITAILLGKDKNKDLAQTLQTDKSFVAKQVKELEEQGLVKKEEEGREVRYVADQFNILKFLQSKVVITSKKDGKTGEEKNG